MVVETATPTINYHDTEQEEELAKESSFISLKDKKELNWPHILLLTITPILAIYGIFTIKFHLYTTIFTFLMYLWTGLGITAGYHRLWSHRAYSARYLVRLALCLGGAAAFEGSIKWWSRNHRAHHRYTDTSKDPYNALNGFWYSHMGWMLYKQNVNKIGRVDIADLQRDPMVKWQHKNYALIAILVGVIFPVIIASFWGDTLGGFFFAAMLRIVIVHHATFFVNSLAHSLGEKSYSDLHTSYDSVVTAILTLGEGYHNYHHEFPHDYRNGIRFYHYDPTKWLIGFLSYFGLTYNLQQISEVEIKKARLQMKQRKLDQEKSSIQYGKKFDRLPEMTWLEIKKLVAEGEQLVVLDDYVHDIKNFVHDHPGGRQTLLNWIGQDITSLFNGKDSRGHTHEPTSSKYLLPMRVGIIKYKEKGA